MKAFTDIEQSIKLAEILPIESADMHYNVVGDTIIGDYQSGISSAKSVAKAWRKNPDEFAKSVTPCWSLATLTDILRKDFEICIIGYEKAWKCHITNRKNLVTDWIIADNPIDCCYEMILKLYEKNLLNNESIY